jgi:Transmembrane secretion effector
MDPLWRNRDFALLQAGQLLSSAGTQATSIAYPLLVLAVSHSPAQAGLVTFARLAPFALFGLVAGVAVDRWSRKALMIASDAVRALAMGALAVLLVSGVDAVWAILLAAFVEGTGTTVFNAAQPGALRAVVPRPQLPGAVGAQEARRASVRLGGPPVGGALFGLGRAVPFAVDAASYICSTVSLLLMRAPFQEEREAAPSRVRAQIAEGFRFLWDHPFLRTTTFLYGLGNFLVPGVLLVVVVVGRRQGLTGGEIGLLIALFGAGTLVGSLASPLSRKLFSIRTILLLELWTWLACWSFVIEPSVYVLVASMVPFALAAPSTDSVVVGYRVAMTPDRLLGRVESVRSNIALLIAPLGPLVAGLLLSVVSARATIALFAVFGLVLALWGTLSPAIRDAPSLDELASGALLVGELDSQQREDGEHDDRRDHDDRDQALARARLERLPADTTPEDE